MTLEDLDKNDLIKIIRSYERQDPERLLDAIVQNIPNTVIVDIIKQIKTEICLEQ